MHFKKIIALTIIFIYIFSFSTYAATIGVVNTDVLNFRSGAGTGYQLLGQFVRGEMMQITEYTNDEWVKVLFNGRVGYVSKKYLSIREDLTNRGEVDRNAPVSIEASGYITASSLNFRTSPEIGNNVITTIPLNTQVWVIESVGNGWAKIYYNNVAGYVSMEYIAMGQAPQASTVSSKVVELAASKAGRPYVYGAAGPNSFDCSGFVQYIYSQVGISLNRTSYSQVNNGYYVDKNSLKPGDIVFFKQGGSVDHVGIYMGNGKMIHASKPGDVVKYDSIVSGYYNNCYYTARRVL